ncbi:isocitrate lyase/phosphoenolpyruvate mutase family protein [Rheinheimera sp. 1928-s]|uniref:isocitrate lyase/PEP mutase family protein n=1 Tax=Rheinheimera sp. 1928-s TaxID=3033803 RepID=UPI002617CE36|nr:isocitrate lyase/phosphoenolpyruvate mutase family protein [Rheinheimera sp. 1928-s]MDF3125313.1 isocitrate lyase/phosphoenolpyruvate mutase family protein [Rheinheimera sp. 1928-s]
MTLHHQRLQAALTADNLIKAPGVFDGLSLRLVEQAGFDVGFVSGAGIAFSRFGIADIGLIGMAEVAGCIQLMREISDLPLIVDIDTGFGNALNVQRTVRVFERAGASAMQMEDQVMPKRCGHMKGKNVVSCAEMVGKIHAFVDSRAHEHTLLVARTDALGVTGFDDAMERAHCYLEAGADLLFIEAPKTLQHMQLIAREFGAKVPLVHNLVEGGSSPVASAAELATLGYKMALYPVALLHAFVPTAQALLKHIQMQGSTGQFSQPMLDLMQINQLLGADNLLEQAKKYDAS